MDPTQFLASNNLDCWGGKNIKNNKKMSNDVAMAMTTAIVKI